MTNECEPANHKLVSTLGNWGLPLLEAVEEADRILSVDDQTAPTKEFMATQEGMGQA